WEQSRQVMSSVGCCRRGVVLGDRHRLRRRGENHVWWKMVVRQGPKHRTKRFQIRNEVTHIIRSHPVVQRRGHLELVREASADGAVENLLRILTGNRDVCAVNQAAVRPGKRLATSKQQLFVEVDAVSLANGVALLTTEDLCQILATLNVAVLEGIGVHRRLSSAALDERADRENCQTNQE